MLADVNERAKRRVAELNALTPTKPADHQEVLKGLLDRDKADAERSVGPLKKADDAVEVDTTNLGPDQVVEFVLNLVRAAEAKKSA